MEIIKYENNELQATKEGIDLIKKIQKTKIQLNKMEDELKSQFQEVMEQNNIKSFKLEDLHFGAIYVAPTTSKTLDSKRLKTERPDIYEKYSKTTERKGYVKFSI